MSRRLEGDSEYDMAAFATGAPPVLEALAARASGGFALTTRTAETYRELKRRIVEIELLPGVLVTEAELATEFCVSKTPAREALARLVAEGFVEPARNGYRVAPVTIRGTEELFDLRLLLEPEAVARAAVRGLDANVRRSLAALAEPECDRDDPAGVATWVRANTAFHILLASTSGSRLLADVLERVVLEMARVVRLALSLPGRLLDSLPEHAELLRLVDDGRADDARRYVVASLAECRIVTLEALASSDVVRTANVLPAETGRHSSSLPSPPPTER